MLENLESRLAALERANCRWKWSSIGLGVGFLAVTAIAADKPAPVMPDIVFARKFVAVNDRNEPIAVLGHSKNVGLIGITDPEGKMLFVASASDHGHGLVATFDDDGRKLVTIGANPAGEGRVTTHDPRDRLPVAKRKSEPRPSAQRGAGG
ncbi:MAG TPA: hypothetical protein VMV69_18245 [Pirellulales bacterium]|nr:hypothetical protein [Pirellulales bacterium]